MSPVHSPRPISDAYALVPRPVVQSEAYRALPDWAVRVLVAMACQYNGCNNGELRLTQSNFRRLGARAVWHVDAGVALLEEVGLLRRTRDAGRPLLGGSLFALTWIDRDWPTDGQASGYAKHPPSNEWAEWEMPSGWSNLVRATKRAARDVLPGGSHHGVPAINATPAM